MEITECLEELRDIPKLACQASEMMLDPESRVDKVASYMFCNAAASHIIMIICVNLFVDNWPLIGGELCVCRQATESSDDEAEIGLLCG